MPGLRLTITNPVVRYPAAAACGVVLSLAFLDIGTAVLVPFAIAPVLALLWGAGPLRGALVGLAFGLGFFGALLFWIRLVGYLAWVSAVIVQSAFAAVFGSFAGLLPAPGKQPGRAIILRAAGSAVLWVGILEYLRSLVPFGGLPWGQLAQSQVSLWTVKAASLAGGWLVALLLVVAAALLAEATCAHAMPRRAVALVAAAAVVVTSPVFLGVTDPDGPAARLAVVQGGVPRDFPGTTGQKNLAITVSHSELTQSLSGEDLDLVVWPESAIGEDHTLAPDFALQVADATRAVGTPLLAGGNAELRDGDNYGVMIFLFDEGGDLVDSFRKMHLVPFGEYVPVPGLRRLIRALDQVPRDALPGEEVVLFDVAGGRVAPAISYEGDFGPLVRERIALGGQLLVVATNTSSYGETPASRQHVAFSQVRAVENGVWVAHAALSGISAFVAPSGEVVSSLDLWTTGVLTQEVRFATSLTPYGRTGDWLPRVCLGASLLVLALGLRRGRNGKVAPR